MLECDKCSNYGVLNIVYSLHKRINIFPPEFIYKLFLEHSLKCSPTVKLHLSRTYCTNLYCSHLWDNLSKADYSKLRVSYNNAMRRLFNFDLRCSASAMHTYIRASVAAFMQRISNIAAIIAAFVILAFCVTVCGHTGIPL